ncbi:unnamed protein product [Closterium sp. NIES-64]|nr:unnamed protein product [Closterium sp. NIES-64]
MFRSSPVSGSRYVSQVRPEPRAGKDGGSDIDEGDSVHDEASSLLRSDARPFPTSVGAAGGIFGGSYGGGGGGGFRKGNRRLRTLAACAALVVAALVLAACAVVDVADAWLGFGGTRRAAGLERCVPQDIPGRCKGSGGERWGGVENGRVGNVRLAAGLERCVPQDIPGRCKGNCGDRWGMVGNGGWREVKVGCCCCHRHMTRAPLAHSYTLPSMPVPSLAEMTVEGGEGGVDDADKRASRGEAMTLALVGMTVEEKVGQMMQIDERALGYGDNITVYHIGSVLRQGNITVYHIGSGSLLYDVTFESIKKSSESLLYDKSFLGAWLQYAPNTPTAWADMVDNFQAKVLNMRVLNMRVLNMRVLNMRVLNMRVLNMRVLPVSVFPSCPCFASRALPPVLCLPCFAVSYASGGGAWPQYAPNTPRAWADMVDNFQAKALNTRLRLPVLYGVDAVHGHNNVQGATIFPHHVGLGAGGDATLVEAIAAAVAKGATIFPHHVGLGTTGNATLVEEIAAAVAKVPVLYGVDAVHGHNNVQGASIFLHHVGLEAAGKGVKGTGQAAQHAAAGAGAVWSRAAVAKEVAATGVRWTFAPAVTVCLDPRWGRCYESYGANPGLVTELAIAEIRGWMKVPSEAGNFPGSVFMAPTAKHYVGDGGTRGGVDRGETVGGEAVLRKVHLLPYVAAVAEGVSTIMASYSSWNGTKMHGNGYLLTDVLRKELGFVGLMVSDWEALKELPGSYEDQVALGVNSGLDMIMVPNDFANFSTTLTSLVNSGRVPMSRIDEAVSRVLSLKHSLGLFDKDLVCARHSSSFFSSSSSSLSSRFLPFFGCPEHRQLARKAVAASLVLLQDKWRRGGTGSGYNAAVWGRGRKKMFPLPVEGAKIVVAGSHANDIGRQCGGWTITWQGEEGPITKGTTIWQGIKDLIAGRAASLTYIGYPPEDDRYENGTRKRPLEATREAAAAWAKRARSVEADLGIIVVGEPPYAEYKGDDQQLELSGPARSTIFGICGRIPCVVVVVSGRPLNVTGMLPHLDALIAAWLPGSEGGGVADVLFDEEVDFKGKLPLPWFRSVRDLQPDHSWPNPPLFPMGFGLSKAGELIGNRVGGEGPP